MDEINYSRQRRADNELLFKENNEAVVDMANGLLGNENKETMPLSIACECSNMDCIETLSVTYNQYQEIRSNENRFIVKKEHQHPDIEDVVGENEEYVVVEKKEAYRPE